MKIGTMDYIQAITVSIIALIMVFILYLYMRQNRYIMNILVYIYRPSKAELKKDTGAYDWFLLIILIAVIIIMGVKLVTLMVVISDSMKPEFQKGDIILTQSLFLNPEMGDIITFNVQDRRTAVSHRVVEVTESGRIITRGDNAQFNDNFQTYQKDVIAKAIQVNGHPIVIKNLGALFITDYSKEGVIFKFGDRFTFLQQLSATIRAWGIVITILALIAYLISMKR